MKGKKLGDDVVVVKVWLVRAAYSWLLQQGGVSALMRNIVMDHIKQSELSEQAGSDEDDDSGPAIQMVRLDGDWCPTCDTRVQRSKCRCKPSLIQTRLAKTLLKQGLV